MESAQDEKNREGETNQERGGSARDSAKAWLKEVDAYFSSYERRIAEIKARIVKERMDDRGSS